MITVKVTGRHAVCQADDPITTGSIGMPVQFYLNAAWKELAPVAVFRADDVSVDIVLIGGSCTVPPEVLQTAGSQLWVGVYGRNAAGTIAIPTIWAAAGTIRPGTEPGGVDPAEPTPDWTAQVQQIAADAMLTAHAAEATAAEADERSQAAVTRADAAISQAAETLFAAQQAARDAAASADSADTSADFANASEQAAGRAATAAQSAATAAAASETNAAGSATAADQSAAGAAASAAEAQRILDSIPEDYTELVDEVAAVGKAVDDVKQGSGLLEKSNNVFVGNDNILSMTNYKTLAEGQYIGETSVLRTGSAVRCIYLEINPGSTYTIHKKTSSEMRAATCNDLDFSSSGHSQSARVVDNAYIEITARETDNYLLIQLFKDADPVELQSVESNIAHTTVMVGIMRFGDPLSEQINKLQAELDEMVFDVGEIDFARWATAAYPSGWRNGYWTLDTGSNKSSNTRIRINSGLGMRFDSSVKKIVIEHPPEFKAMVLWATERFYTTPENEPAIGYVGCLEQATPAPVVIENNPDYCYVLYLVAPYNADTIQDVVSNIHIKYYSAKKTAVDACIADDGDVWEEE